MEEIDLSPVIREFRSRREKWGEDARNLPSHQGKSHRVRLAGQSERRYSFAGAGVHAMMEQWPGHVGWGPARTEHGLEIQNLETASYRRFMDFYGINGDTLDHTGTAGGGTRRAGPSHRDAGGRAHPLHAGVTRWPR